MKDCTYSLWCDKRDGMRQDYLSPRPLFLSVPLSPYARGGGVTTCAARGQHHETGRRKKHGIMSSGYCGDRLSVRSKFLSVHTELHSNAASYTSPTDHRSIPWNAGHKAGFSQFESGMGVGRLACWNNATIHLRVWVLLVTMIPNYSTTPPTPPTHT